MKIARIFCCGLQEETNKFEENTKKRDKLYDYRKTFDTITNDDMTTLVENLEKVLDSKRRLKMTDTERCVAYFAHPETKLDSATLKEIKSLTDRNFECCLKYPRENGKTYENLLVSSVYKFLNQIPHPSQSRIRSQSVHLFIHQLAILYDANYYKIPRKQLIRDLHYAIRFVDFNLTITGILSSFKSRT